MSHLFAFVAGIAFVKLMDWVAARERLFRQDGIGEADEYKVGGSD